MKVSMPQIVSQGAQSKSATAHVAAAGKFSSSLLDALKQADEKENQKLPDEILSQHGIVKGGKKADAKTTVNASAALIKPETTLNLVIQQEKNPLADATKLSIPGTSTSKGQKAIDPEVSAGKDAVKSFVVEPSPGLRPMPGLPASVPAQPTSRFGAMSWHPEGSEVAPDRPFVPAKTSPHSAEGKPSTESPVDVPGDRGLQKQEAISQMAGGLETSRSVTHNVAGTTAEPRFGSHNAPHRAEPQVEIKSDPTSAASRLHAAPVAVAAEARAIEAPRMMFAADSSRNAASPKTEQGVAQANGAAHRRGAESRNGDASRSSKGDAATGSLATPKSSIGTGAANNGAAPQKTNFPAEMQVSSAAAHEQAAPNATSAKHVENAIAAKDHNFAGLHDSDAAAELTGVQSYSPLQTARLVERMGQSEFRVGLHAGEFGKVDIRTSLARHQFTAEISVERGELGRVLAAELPSLHSRLSEQQLPQAHIILQQHAGEGSGGSRQESRQAHPSSPMNAGSAAEREDFNAPVMAADAWDSTGRLDIHL